MTPGDRERLTAVEQELADAVRQLRATRAQLSVLRALLEEEAPAVDTISSAGDSAAGRPVLRALDGGLSGAHRHVQGRDRHGLRAV